MGEGVEPFDDDEVAAEVEVEGLATGEDSGGEGFLQGTFAGPVGAVVGEVEVFEAPKIGVLD